MCHAKLHHSIPMTVEPDNEVNTIAVLLLVHKSLSGPAWRCSDDIAFTSVHSHQFMMCAAYAVTCHMYIAQ